MEAERSSKLQSAAEAWDAALAQTPGRVELLDAGESILERRAWELFRNVMDQELEPETWARICFDYTEFFAAEAAKRREAAK